MSSPTSKRTYSIDDFVGFLAALIEGGFEVVVIGGCAVGAYSRMLGWETLSEDLDLYCTRQTLNAVVAWGPHHGIVVERRPQPRSVPVAVLRWSGLEVNLLTESHGLPAPPEVARLARIVRLSRHGGLSVLIADPVDLLANKLRVNRPKDKPHVATLQRFAEEEIVHAFRETDDPRDRLAPARRFLDATRSRVLPEALAVRLLDLVRTGADLRFLMNHVPTAAQADRVLDRARDRTDVAPAELEDIRRHRRFR